MTDHESGIQPVSARERGKGLLARLLDIWEGSVRKTHDFLPEGAIDAIRPEVAQGISAVEHLYCFFDADGMARGFIGIENGKIEMLFIDAEFRGRGIGRRLLNYAVYCLGAKYVDVNEQNFQGVGFYCHMGFAILSRDEFDSSGRPFPILHLVHSSTSRRE